VFPTEDAEEPDMEGTAALIYLLAGVLLVNLFALVRRL